MPELPIVDPDSIANLRDLNPGDNGAFLKEIIAIYLEDTPRRLDDLAKSLAAGDLVSFARAAHTIKGSSSNVGAMALRATAERLEHTARTEGLGKVGPQVAECQADFARAEAELRRLAAGA
jgi:histidine phosphotransfer protein HptB